MLCDAVRRVCVSIDLAARVITVGDAEGRVDELSVESCIGERVGASDALLGVYEAPRGRELTTISTLWRRGMSVSTSRAARDGHHS